MGGDDGALELKKRGNTEFGERQRGEQTTLYGIGQPRWDDALSSPYKYWITTYKNIS